MVHFSAPCRPSRLTTLRCVLLIAVTGIGFILADPRLRAECVFLRPDERGTLRAVEPPVPEMLPPIVITGALCGTTVADGLKPDQLEGFPLDLVNETGRSIATLHTDTKAIFEFTHLTPGQYRLQPPAPFASTVQPLQITGRMLVVDSDSS